MSQMLRTTSGDDNSTFQMVMETLMKSMVNSTNDNNGQVSELSALLNSDGQYEDSNGLSYGINNSEYSDEDSGNVSIDEAVDKASKEYNVDKKLIMGVINQESSFNPNAVSSAGAQGLMQLMPSTAKELGVTDSFNVEQNVEGGTKYLKELLDMYGNSKEMALAAYNAGPNAVNSRGMNRLPNETENYVSKIMKYYNSNK